jgi:DUF2997 family protein
MSAARIVVTVSPAGVVSAHTEGVYGERCLDYIEVLENLLEARTVESSYTADHARVEEPSHVEHVERDLPDVDHA